MPLAVFAFEKGDIAVRGGLITKALDEFSSNIFVGGLDLDFGVSVDDNAKLYVGIGLNYFI
jgi:hypothetical protein